MKVKMREPNNRRLVVHSKRSDFAVVQLNQRRICNIFRQSNLRCEAIFRSNAFVRNWLSLGFAHPSGHGRSATHNGPRRFSLIPDQLRPDRPPPDCRFSRKLTLRRLEADSLSGSRWRHSEVASQPCPDSCALNQQ